MKDATHYYNSLAEWYKNPLGRQLFVAVDEQLAHCASHFHATYFVQLGLVDCLTWSRHVNAPHKWYFSPAHHLSEISAKSDFLHLPLQAESVDVIFMPHALEVYKDPRPLLQEAIQALAPGGRLVILGVNPLSTWGLAKPFKRKSSGVFLGHWHSVPTLLQWLAQCDMSVPEMHYFGYRPPCQHNSTWQRWAFIESFARFTGLWPAGWYVMVAQKNQLNVTPLVAKPLLKEWLGDKSLQPSV